MKLDIAKISKDYRKKHILVIGDIILDAYIHGKVDRVSQEAPVPIVSVHRNDYKPGGAANVALNLAGLGASVTLIGIVGKDENNEYLVNQKLEDSQWESLMLLYKNGIFTWSLILMMLQPIAIEVMGN